MRCRYGTIRIGFHIVPYALKKKLLSLAGKIFSIVLKKQVRIEMGQ